MASRYGSFPVLLETYRECLRDVFDMPALIGTLGDVRSRKVRIATVDSETPSPFAASLLFTYVASFIYDGDAPLAERRAQALSVDQSQLRELLGDAELRELLDAESIEVVERQLQRLDPQYLVKSADGLHDLLLSLGDLTRGEIVERSISADVAASVEQLVAARRALAIRIAGDPRFIAVEDAARFRDALACHCRSVFLSRCCSRCAIRSAISRCAMRGRTRHSRRPTSPRATAWLKPRPKPC